jgi:hypothetical protein
MGHEADVTGIDQAALHTDQHLGKEGVAEIVDDDANHVRRLASQVGCPPVVHITERDGALSHPLGGLAGNQGAAL